MDAALVHFPNWNPSLPLNRFRASTEPYTTIDVGWDREVWPEFTCSQLHLYDVGFTENPQRSSKFHISPMEISFVSLSNRSDSFESWLADGLNPRVRARFNNHMTFGSAASWESNWGGDSWHGQIQVQGHWAGMLAQRIAEINGETSQFDGETGAWLVAPGVPIIQYQRGVLEASAMRHSKRHGTMRSTSCLVGQMQVGTPRRCRWNRPFLRWGQWRSRMAHPGNGSRERSDR